MSEIKKARWTHDYSLRGWPHIIQAWYEDENGEYIRFAGGSIVECWCPK